MPSLVDWWFGHIASYGQELDDWAEMVFLLWGQHELPSIAEEQLDGDLNTPCTKLCSDWGPKIVYLGPDKNNNVNDNSTQLCWIMLDPNL